MAVSRLISQPVGTGASSRPARLALPLSLLLMAGLGLVMGVSAQPSPLAGALAGSAASPDAATSAPRLTTALRTTGRQLSVQVHLNGEGPFLFTIDTGSGASVCLDEELAERLALPTVGETSNGDGSGTFVLRPVVGIESLRLGGHDFGEQQALIADYRFISGTGDDRVMGILGLPLFEEGVVTLDAPGEELRWTDAPLARDAHTLDYITPRGIPEVTIRCGDTKLKVTVDTGFVGSIGMTDAMRGTVPVADEPVVVGQSRGPNGRGGDVWGATLATEIEFAGQRVEDSPVLFMEGRPRSYLGGELLRGYVLSFDLDQRLLEVLAPSG